MPVLRNPFKKSVNINGAPGTVDQPELSPATLPISQHDRKSSTSSISILAQQRDRDEDPDTYQLCEVNDSGIYLPPPAPEKRSFWRRSDASTRSLPKHRESLQPIDDGGFAISRESFDSYRRSFDISARSPVPGSINSSRQSLDQRPSRASLDAGFAPARHSFDVRMHSNDGNQKLPSDIVSESLSEEDFKDVDLNDTPAPKKRSFLARMVGGSHGDHIPEAGEQKGRSRSSTLTWRKDTNKESEELGEIAAEA